MANPFRWMLSTSLDRMRTRVAILTGTTAPAAIARSRVQTLTPICRDASLFESSGSRLVSRLAELIEEHGEAFALFAEHEGAEFATGERFEDSYRGEWDSLEDYAEDCWEQTGDLDKVPEFLRYHIDWSAVARDMTYGDIWSDRCEGSVYVFQSL